MTTHTGSAASDLQYDGQYTDAETGYEYLRARYYDPSTGQFLTVDPAIKATGSSYQYASDDPVRFGDPLGLWAFATCVGGDASAAGVVGGSVSGEICDWTGGNGLWPSWSAVTFTPSAGVGVGLDAGVSGHIALEYDLGATSPEDLAGPGCSESVSGSALLGGSVSVGCNGDSGGFSVSLGPQGGASFTVSGSDTDVIWSSTGYRGWGKGGSKSQAQCVINYG